MPIYEHEGIIAYRLMYFMFPLSIAGQIDWHTLHLWKANWGLYLHKALPFQEGKPLSPVAKG
jgi:hypothetical protein